MSSELLLLKAAFAMASVEPYAAVCGGILAALLLAFALEVGTEEALGQILLAMAGLTISAGPVVWVIFNLFLVPRLGVHTLPTWHLMAFAIGAAVGFMVGFYLIRRFTPTIERAKKRLTLRTRLERNRRTDVRDIEAFVPKRQAEYDPRQYFKAGDYFLGLDEDGKPVYWLGRLPHVQLVGTTGAGKGVALGMIAAQALLNGAGVLFIDPKDDEWAPTVIFDAAQRAGVSYRFVDLRPTAPAQLNLFAGATAAEIEELFLAGFGLSDKGEPADFYRVADRQAGAMVAQVAAQRQDTPASLYAKVRSAIDEAAPYFSGLLAEMAHLPAVNGRGGYDLAELLESGGAVYVVGSMRNAKVLRMQRMLLVRLIQLAERRDRTAAERPRAVLAVLDELKTQISRPAMESLQAARDKGVSILMAHQAVADLRDCPADMDPNSVVGGVMENCALKLCYRVQDPDTAEWLAKKSGVIQVDDEVRSVKKSIALAESIGGERSIRQAERFLVDENMLQNLPNRVGVVYGLGLAKFVQTAPLKVEKTVDALQVIAAPEGDVYEAPEPQRPKRGKRPSKSPKEAEVSAADDLEKLL
jgi:MFS family permease